MADPKSASCTATNYIGARVARASAKALLAGRGCYVEDIKRPRMLHMALFRSPFAHAKIVRIDTAAATSTPGVVRVLTGGDVAKVCQPYLGVLVHLKGMRSMPQYPLAIDCARWQGEPVAAVVAQTRALAEDAAQLIEVEWEELPAVTDPAAALSADSPVIHRELGDNLFYERKLDTGGVDEAFARADVIVEETFVTNRHTPVPLEPRSILAEYNAASNHMTVWQSTQEPYMMQWIVAKHFALPETNVRVVVPDVGGSFGLKINIFGDEMAAIAASRLLGRPVRFIADRLESFVSDIHSRGHRMHARMAVAKTGEILATEVDDLFGIGPYSTYPRGSANEGVQVFNLVAAQYGQRVYRSRSRGVFQNKAMYAQYRAVGHPVACLVTEGLVELAAAAVGLDPVDMRRRNYIAHDAYPHKLVSGITFEKLSLQEALDKIVALIGYDSLRAEQAQLRKRGIFRGVGLAGFVENSNYSSATYGQGGASIAAQDACTIKLTATGAITVASSQSEMGQGSATVLAQVAATALGVPLDRVKMVMGDTDATPYGGGNTGSRGAGIGGEAALRAGSALRHNILAFVARLRESEVSLLDVRDGNVVDAASGEVLMSLEHVARTAFFRTELVPKDFQPELTVTRSYAQKDYAGVYTNGIHASWLEVDVETGIVKLLKHWVVDDCGTVINPLLVQEQLRGGVVQGLGGALFEECLYSPEGQLMNGSLIDYLVPMAAEMPDIEVGHCSTPTKTSTLGAKGAGEAGVAGASAAVMNAINDALTPFGTRVKETPFTPERILNVLHSARKWEMKP